MSKRTFDWIAMILTSPIWVPVLLITILLMAIMEGRPIFYGSRRRVQRSLNTRIWKFRTMVRNAESVYNREVVPVTNQRFLNTPSSSPLYTRLGRWIERCQITELPQIFHVMAGQMTIVGNRPLPENVIESLREIYPNVEERFRTPAGLTGLTQLIGREELSDVNRLNLECHYCRASDENYSARLDVLILVYTILIVLRLKRPYNVRQAHELIDRFSPGSWAGVLESSHASATMAERDAA